MFQLHPAAMKGVSPSLPVSFISSLCDAVARTCRFAHFRLQHDRDPMQATRTKASKPSDSPYMSHRVFSRALSSFKNSTALKRPVLDIKRVLANEHEMRDSIARRKADTFAQLDFLVANRHVETEMQSRRNLMQNQRKQLGAEMASQAKRGENTDALRSQLASYKHQLSLLEKELLALSQQIHDCAESLPNWLSSRVPADPQVAEVVEVINGASEHEVETKLPPTAYDHRDIGLQLNIMEFSKASQISGSSWYYLLNDGALLEQALVQYALAEARKNGYSMVAPPSIVKSEIVNACGFKPKDQNGEKQVYTIHGEELSLTGTAEIPLGALHSQETISTPRKYVGVSRAYRAEAGARGKDTTGLYRVHEFTKVEMFHFTDASNSDQELEALRSLQTSIIGKLGLSAKMLNMPTTDLGAPAMMKYDCEAWMPGRGSWGELTSCSNCGDYQARRLGVRTKSSLGSLEYVHTLNGTAMAVPRVMVAILEQFYDPETESVAIPKVLRPYMDGKDRIVKQ